VRRFHLFELNEKHWVPSIIRDSVVETVFHTLRRRRVLASMVGPFRDFLRRSGATEVLDLCSGTGGAALMLADEFLRLDIVPPRIILTDLFPRVGLRSEIPDKLSDSVQYWPESMNATQVPKGLADGRPRMIHNGLHHFPPDAARAILEDAVNNSSGIFVSEIFPRGLVHYFHLVLTNFWIVPALPILTSNRRLWKALLFFPVPATPIAVLWDCLVSSLRMYTEAELRHMVAPLGDRFEWVFGTCRYPPAGTATYFYGVPRSSRP
jgi:hypothetical protein